MKYSLRSSFARWVLGLFFAVLALTILGRAVAITGAIAYCDGFPFCAPSHPLGWLKQAHIALVGIASIVMLIVFRKAWREQREQRVLQRLDRVRVAAGGVAHQHERRTGTGGRREQGDTPQARAAARTASSDKLTVGAHGLRNGLVGVIALLHVDEQYWH